MTEMTTAELIGDTRHWSDLFGDYYEHVDRAVRQLCDRLERSEAALEAANAELAAWDRWFQYGESA